MMSTIISSLNKRLQAVEISNRCRRSKKNVTPYTNTSDRGKQLPETKKVKKRVRFAETEPTIIAAVGDQEPVVEEEETDKRAGVRITVKLTKREADRMLSRCSNGDLGDVACELMRITDARVRSSVLAS